jgi:Protein of unknown function (DUF3379)
MNNNQSTTLQELSERLLSNPRDPSLKSLATELPEGELLLARALKFEHQIERALQFPIADAEQAALQARLSAIAAHDAFNVPARNPIRHWLLAAAAISAIGLGAYLLNAPNLAFNQALAKHCVEHLNHEPFALTRTQVVPANLVARMLQTSGFATSDAMAKAQADSIGPVNYLMPCEVDGMNAMHLVVQTASGPVTVMLVPEAKLVRASESQIGAARVRLSPLAPGVGAVVLLAESGVMVEAIEDRFVRALAVRI